MEEAAQAGVLDELIDEMERVANDDSLMVKLSAMPENNPEESYAHPDSV